MCYCGWLQRDGIFNCCEKNLREREEEAKMEGFKKEWERQVSKGYFENNKKTFVESAIEGAKNIMQKGEKNKVAAAYRPIEEEIMNFATNTVPPPPKAGPSIKPANETPREELLQRDVGILFEENQRLRKHIDELLSGKFEKLLEHNVKLFEANKRLFLENQKLKGENNANV